MKEFIDKLISRLEEKVNQCSPLAEEYIGGKFDGFRQSIAIVNELAEEYNNGWIPCSERLPEAGTHRDVWISIANEVVAYKAKWYLDHFEWENGWVIKETILAWMPNDIPAPYTKGE